MDKGNDGVPASPHQFDLAFSESDYPEWDGEPKRTLLLCTQMRSGSSLLAEAIHLAGGLGCPLEYFHTGIRPLFKRRETRDIRDFARMIHRVRTDPSGVFSVKLMWQDIVDLIGELAPAELGWISRSTSIKIDASIYRRIHATIMELFPNPTFVYLTRNDTIAQAVSLSIATQTRQWRQFSNSTERPPPPYSFDHIVQGLAQIRQGTQHWRNFFQANGLRYHTLTYEELAEDYDATIRRLFAWLNRPDAPIAAPRLKKQADAQSEEIRRRFLAEFRHRAGG